MVKSQIRSMNDVVRALYYFYFDYKIDDQDKFWATLVRYLMCLKTWLTGTKKRMPYAVPMI